jgi:hypothetical protein
MDGNVTSFRDDLNAHLGAALIRPPGTDARRRYVVAYRRMAVGARPQTSHQHAGGRSWPRSGSARSAQFHPREGGKAMNRLFSIGGSGLLIGAAAFVLLPRLNKGDVLIAGDRPVNSEQVRQKLQLDGWSNLEIARKGRYIVAVGSKDGQDSKIWVNAKDGRLRVFDDDHVDGDEDDDDDD